MDRPTFLSISLKAVRRICNCIICATQARNYGGVLGAWIHALFFKRMKVPFFLVNCESSLKKCIHVIIIKLECSESRKIPVIFLPFPNLKNIIQSYILYKKISVCPFLWIRPLPSKISSCAPALCFFYAVSKCLELPF